MSSLADLLKKDDKPIPVKQKNIYISQSLMKDLFDKHQEVVPHCPLMIYEKYITKQYRTEATESMQAGLLGETIILGASAKGGVTEALRPNKITGKPLTTEVNVRQMCELAQKVLTKHQVNIIKEYNTQVPINKHVRDNVYFLTELDLFPTMFIRYPDDKEAKIEIACIDIKFAPDAHGGFGAFDWSNVQYLDHCQPDSIFYLLTDFDIELNKKFNPDFDKKVGYDNVFTSFIRQHLNKVKFYYMVIGYKKEIDFKQIRYIERLREDEQNLRQKDFKQRLNKTINQVQFYNEFGWNPHPYHHKIGNMIKGCIKCPVNKSNGGYCDKADEIVSV